MTVFSTTARLAAVAPFDFDQSLRFVGGFAPMRGELVVGAQTLTRALLIDGQTVLAHIRDDGSAPGLLLTLIAEQQLSAAGVAAASDQISFFLSLDDELAPFYAIGRADAIFAPIIDLLYGYHQVKFPTPFECACWAVLIQRTLTSQARTMKNGLVARFGGAISWQGAHYQAFPTADRLAAAPPQALTELCGTLRKAEYLAAVALAFSVVDQGWLRAAPYDEVAAWLRAIPGIGPWSATFILLRGLGRMDQAPVEERALAQAVARHYGAAHAGAAAIRALADRYGPWQGYWAHYLRVAS